MAVYIYNFTKFLDWSTDTFANDFCISVLGKSDIVYSLREVARRERINGKSIIVKELKNIDEINNCQILYISKDEKESISEIIKFTKDKKILTVGNAKGFSQRGVGINFITIDNKIRFEINITSLNLAGITAKTQLLSLATRIYK